jgi:chromosome segregation ATPase
MIKRIIFALPLAGALFVGCDTKEKAMLQSTVDSLRVELDASQKVAETLQEVGVLMDSIDASRQLLKVNMVEGTTYDDYTARMKDINGYVKETQNKINELEAEAKKSNAYSGKLSKTIKSLQKDLASKSEQIAVLQQQVDQVMNENKNLSETVNMQDAMLEDKEAQILAKQQELALIEARIQELMIQSKMSEGDAYYARGMAVEEAAARTKLAPRKKKETLKEALELYKKSLSLGKTEAQAKIDELEKKI